MADPLSITCGVIALVSFALSSSVTLSATIRSFKAHNRHTRALLDELQDLANVLEALLTTMETNPDVDFDALKSPLDRCGVACKEYGELIARCQKHSTETHASMRDWIRQKYMQGDVTDFRDMLAGYKSTINIAIANVNIRVAAITPKVLEDYRKMISDTSQDLEDHLEDIDAKIKVLSSAESSDDCDEGSSEWKAILEEKKCTQQGLDMCAQLSAQVDDKWETALAADWQSSTPPEAREHVRNGLSATRVSIRTMEDKLRSHEDVVERRIVDLTSAKPMTARTATDLQRLQAEKESIGECIQMIAAADEETSVIERHNVFEDITLADHSFSFTVSTVGDLVTARRINLSGGSCNVGGQISEEGFLAAVESFTRHGRQAPQDTRDNVLLPTREKEIKVTGGFRDRYGPGKQLERTTQVSRLSTAARA